MTDLMTSPAPTEPSSGLRRVAALSASLVGTYAITSVVGMAFWLVAARRFPIESVGVAGAAVAAMLLLGTLGTCGLGTLLIARLPHADLPRRLVRTSLAVAGTGGAMLALGLPLLAVHVGGLDDLRAIVGSAAIAALFVLGTALTSVTIVLDQAALVRGSGHLQLERNTVASVVKLAALVGLSVTDESSGMVIFLAWAIGNLVSLPWVAWRTRGGRRHDDGRPLLDLRVLRGLGGQAASHHALNTSLQAPLQILPLLVLIGISEAGNGVFSTALQVTGAVFALPFAISIALFASAVGSPRDVLDRMRVTLPLSLGISVLANVVLFAAARPVLSLFGADYSAQGVEVLRILALAGIPFVVKDHYVALRRVQGRTTHATAVLVGLGVVELVAASVGMALDGLVGLCAWWLGALLLESLVLGWALFVAARGRVDAGSADAAPLKIASLGSAPVDAAPITAATTGTAPVEAASPEVEPGLLRRVATLLGPGPALLVMSLGLVLVARAVALAHADGGAETTAQALYVGGLVVVFLPAALAVLLPGLRISTRVVLAVAMLMLLQVSRLVVDPVRFVRHDELSHLNGLRMIEESGRLFGDNPLLPVTSYFPGIQVAADAIHDLTGLGDHASAVVVLLAARLVLALGVLLVVAWVTGSMRIGAAAVVVYACNLQMLAFNAQFAYQTLALPLAALTVYLLLSRRHGSRLALVPAVLSIWAVAASHHLTAMLLIIALLAWALLERVLRRGRPRAVTPMLVLAAAGAVGVGAMILNPGNPVAGYLEQIGDSAVGAVQVLLGGGPPRRLFQNAAGDQSAVWERYAILASLVLTLAALLVALWRARALLPARNSLVVLLLLLAMVFPVIPAGHLTTSTAEVADRSAGFVYLGVAFAISWWWWRRPMSALRATLFALTTTVVFVGGVVLGAGSIANQLPGSFRVSDDARTVDADNLAAVEWMADHLPPSVAYGDRTNGRLAAAYAGQYVVTHVGTDVDASRLLLDPEFTPEDVRLIRETGIRYLVADRRNANGLPNQGVYIESGEFGEAGRTTAVPADALRKFSAVPGVDAIYDNGSVVIYDLEALDAP